MRDAIRSAFLLMLFFPLGAPVALALHGETTSTPVIVAADVAPAAPAAPLDLNSLVLANLAQTTATNDPTEFHCLAQAVYFEARNQSLEGQLAVAQVVLNRVRNRRYPNHICGVVFQNQHLPFQCQFSFACDGHPDNPYNPVAWKLAQAVAQVALDAQWEDITHRATHYHANYSAPYWSAYLEQTAVHGYHIFYREEG